MRSNVLRVTFLVLAAVLAATAAIAADANVRTMAEIVINLNHFPSDADKMKLTGIANGADSSEDEIAIASALLDLKHQVQDSDREVLAMIAADDSVSSELRELANAVLSINHQVGAEDKAKLQMIAATE